MLMTMTMMMMILMMAIGGPEKMSKTKICYNHHLDKQTKQTNKNNGQKSLF